MEPLLSRPKPPLLPEQEAASGRSRISEGILLVGGMVLFLAMLYEMREPIHGGGFVSPPLLAAAGALVLWPLRRQQAARTVLLAGCALLLLWFLAELSTVLLPFVLAFLLGYLFNPLVMALHRRFHIPRWALALAVTALVVGLVALFALALVPGLLGEVETLAGRALDGIGQLQAWLHATPLLDRFEQTGLIDKEQFVAQIITSIRDAAGSLTENLPRVVQDLLDHLGSLLGLITVLAIMPVLIYYTLKDFPFIKQRLADLFPTFGGQRDYLVQAGEVVGNYLRAQLIICAIAAFNVSVALTLLGVPFALLIGIMAGVLNIIPNLGAIIASVVGVLIAVIFGDPWLLDALVVVLVLTGQNLLEQSVLTPKIMSTQVGLHPVLILLALFVFGYFLGLVGLVIAVPATALLMTVYKAYRHELTFDLAPEAQLKRDLARRLRGRVRQRETKDDVE